MSEAALSWPSIPKYACNDAATFARIAKAVLDEWTHRCIEARGAIDAEWPDLGIDDGADAQGTDSLPIAVEAWSSETMATRVCDAAKLLNAATITGWLHWLADVYAKRPNIAGLGDVSDWCRLWHEWLDVFEEVELGISETVVSADGTHEMSDTEMLELVAPLLTPGRLRHVR